MKKIQFLHILGFILLISVSCVSTGPKVYTSIEGSWRCEAFNSLSGSHSTYIVEIDRKKTDTTQYVITYFENTNYPNFVIAHLTGKNFTIAQQQIGEAQLFVKSGTGIVSDFTHIAFNYTIYDGINEMPVQAVYTR